MKRDQEELLNYYQGRINIYRLKGRIFWLNDLFEEFSIYILFKMIGKQQSIHMLISLKSIFEDKRYFPFMLNPSEFL